MAKFLDSIPIPQGQNQKEFIDRVLAEAPLVMNGLLGQYTLLSYLAGGSVGDVFLGKFTTDPVSAERRFAIKVMPETESTLREAEAYSRLELCGGFITCVIDIFRVQILDKPWIVLVQQLFDIDLFEYKPRTREISDMLMDLLLGLACIHGQGLAHMDIKGENLFTGKTHYGRVYKIGDLGFVCGEPYSRKKFIDLQQCAVSGTYIPPDILDSLDNGALLTTKLAQSIDVWDLGLFFLFKLWQLGFNSENLLPYVNTKASDLFNGLYKRGSIDSTKNILPDLTKLKRNAFGKINKQVLLNVLGQMVKWDSNTRPTAEQILISIVRQMNWASPGKELDYLKTLARKESCASQQTPEITMT